MRYVRYCETNEGLRQIAACLKYVLSIGGFFSDRYM